MSKIDFNALSDNEKREIFEAVATEKGMTPFAVEKDWWVSRTLEIIFKMEIAKHLVFKGGTSLSKAWKLIQRFSEDIDLAIDKEFFEGYKGDISKTQIGKLRKVAGIYTTGVFFEELKSVFNEKGFKNLEKRQKEEELIREKTIEKFKYDKFSFWLSILAIVIAGVSLVLTILKQ